MRPNRMAKFSVILVLMAAQLVCGRSNSPARTPAPTAMPAVVATEPPATAAPTPVPTTPPPPSPTPAASPTAAPPTPTPTANALFEKAKLVAGKWSGKWNNLTFATTGTEQAEISPNPDGTAKLSLALTGHVLGVNAPPPVVYDGTYDASGYVFTAKGDPLFGSLTINIGFDGQTAVTATLLPVAGIAKLTAQGAIINQQWQFTYTVLFTGGASAKGKASLSQVQ